MCSQLLKAVPDCALTLAVESGCRRLVVPCSTCVWMHRHDRAPTGARHASPAGRGAWPPQTQDLHLRLRRSIQTLVLERMRTLTRQR